MSSDRALPHAKDAAAAAKKSRDSASSHLSVSMQAFRWRASCNLCPRLPCTLDQPLGPASWYGHGHKLSSANLTGNPALGLFSIRSPLCGNSLGVLKIPDSEPARCPSGTVCNHRSQQSLGKGSQGNVIRPTGDYYGQLGLLTTFWVALAPLL